MEQPTRKSARVPQPKIRLAEPTSNDDDDNASFSMLSAKTASTKRKSNADNNSSSKSAKTTTTHTSITTEEEQISNKALFNEYNSATFKVTNVGDVGYKFNKEFNGKLYAGVVVEIRLGADNGSDRRCVYADGDLEDLTKAELESFATSHPSNDNNNTDHTSTSASMPALKFNNKTGAEISTTGAGDNDMKVDKVNDGEDNVIMEEVDNVDCGELASAGTAAPPTNAAPKESSIGCDINGSVLAVGSSIAEKGGDMSCAAAGGMANDAGCVSNGYKAASDKAIAAMTGNKDWSQKVKDDKWAKPSKDGETIACEACWGKKNARTGGLITMKRPYDDHRWIDHNATKCHTENVAAIEAREDNEDAPPRAYQETSLFSFFKTVPKKKKENNKVAATEIDLTSDDPPPKPAQVSRVECAGAYNSVNLANAQRSTRREYVRLFCRYLATTSESFRQGSYGGVPSIVSTKCTGIGVFPGKDGGRVCKGCKALRVERGSRNPSVTIDKWGNTLSPCIERRDKNVLTPSDLDDAARFLKIRDDLLSPEGLQLKDEARSQLEYAKHMAKLEPKLKHTKYQKIGDGSVPGMSSLFKEAGELCEKNTDLRDSLVVALLKAAVAKTKYGSNARMEEKVVNFYRFLKTYDPKAAEVMSANLMGPGKRWLQKLDAREREDCIFTCGKDDTIIVERVTAAIKRRTSPDGLVPSFGLAIDATKVAIITFQNTPSGVPPSEIVAARPQSNNESNEFVKSMETSVSLALNSSGVAPKTFISYAVDGVSCESRHVWGSICAFLSCQSIHIGSTDTNHNMKSWRYQVIAGADTQGCTIGKLMIDAYSLRQLVSAEIYCPSDFASDRLVLQLCSNNTIVKLSQADIAFGSTSKGDKGAMGLTLFFMRLHLYAVNGSGVPAAHRAVYLWCSMLWLTSISGACVITKRNVVSETIAFMFIVLRSDVEKPRFQTSEPAEHKFGMMRQIIREFTCLEFVQLADKLTRRLKVMYKHIFRPSRDPEKGYSATFADFYDYTHCSVEDDLLEGTVVLNDDGDYVANQMWEVVSKLISYSSDTMDVLFATLGVTEDEKSPFCRSFSSLDDLREVFISYLPRTFNFSGMQGNGSDQTTRNEEDEDDADHSTQDDDSDHPTESSLIDRINRFAQEMSDDNNNDDSSDDKDNSSEPTAAAIPSVLTANTQELMTHFRAITKVDNIDNILEKVLPASSCLEGKDNMQGAASLVRKSKSLVQRWLAKPEKVKDLPLYNAGDILIKRDVVVLVNIKIGRGATASTVPRPFRVLDIYDKHYNKWFMSKVSKYPVKIWKKDTSYKLKIRMLEKDAVNEYSDVGLYGSMYEKKSICQIIQHSKIIGVVGTLQNVP